VEKEGRKRGGKRTHLNMEKGVERGKKCEREHPNRREEGEKKEKKRRAASTS